VIKEFMLMGLLTAILLAIGFVVGWVFGNPEGVMLIALFIAAAMNMLAYFHSDKIVLKMTGAKLVSEDEAPELHAMVEKVAIRAGLPKPKVAIIDTPVPNAFATGRNPGNAVVAVTTGLLRHLSRSEVEAVIGHEMAHIKHRDVLISAMAATIAGAIAYLAMIGRFSIWFADEDRGEASLLALLAGILAPIAAVLVQAAISREREFKADEGGAKITGKPLALASALEKIEAVVSRGYTIRANPATSSLWIVNPIRGDALYELFSTHPPTWKRVERLRRLARQLMGN